MTQDHQSAPPPPALSWRQGPTGPIPVSALYDDPYFSLNDGLAETRHVFLAGNDLPTRFQPGFHIAELGFGTGRNMLAAWQMWRANGQKGQLRFTSFESHPLPAADLERVLAGLPELADLAQPFLTAWARGDLRFEADWLLVEVIVGDATKTLPLWRGLADAWFLDGFAPARNPALWSEAMMAQVATHTTAGGSFATYTAAGHVRRGLQAAGFQVWRLPGHSGKRHMSAGRMPPPQTQKGPQTQSPSPQG